ncbi:MAG: FAD-binding oxidoreductase [Alphaproteobacteria bacterium]|nr:FAD-binding oxidoreductase [Alphaproteobacteria bacterium]
MAGRRDARIAGERHRCRRSDVSESACDFIVIGAGMAGASAAWALAPHGRVLLLERETMPGYHATGRSAALFAEAYGNPTIRGLTSGGRAFLEHPPPGFAEAPLLAPRGALYVAGAERAGELGATMAEAARLVPTLRLLDHAAARRIVPVLKADYCMAAIHEPHAMAIDVAALHQGYLRAARAAGAVLVMDCGDLGGGVDGGLWTIETGAGRYHAPVVINAAGAWADEVAGSCGLPPIGLEAKRRTALTFRPEGQAFGAWPLVLNLEETLYFKPESGDLMASPADETPSPPCDAQPEEFDVAICIDRLERWTDLKVGRPKHRWAGLRTFAPDRNPVVGFDPLAPGFFWLAGQGGSGIKTAPGLARAVAALARGLPLPADLAERGVSTEAMSPARFRD